MAQERALVLEAFDNPKLAKPWVRVKTQRQSSCSACQMKSSCGQGLLSQISEGKGLELELENNLNAKPGDVVMLSVPDAGVLSASLLMFMLPLLALMMGGGLAQLADFNELQTVIIALLSLAAGFLFVNRFSAKQVEDPKYMPVITSIALNEGSAGHCQS